MQSDHSHESDGRETEERRRSDAERFQLRRYQHDLDMQVFRMEQRLGRYDRTRQVPPVPRPLTWDGIKNSQLKPIQP